MKHAVPLKTVLADRGKPANSVKWPPYLFATWNQKLFANLNETSVKFELMNRR